MKIKSVIAVAAACAAIGACEEKPSAAGGAPKGGGAQQPVAVMPGPKAEPKPATGATSATGAPSGTAAAGDTVKALNLVFAVPEGWKQIPPGSQMRLAEIEVPDASGDAAKKCNATFYSFGGSVQDNIDRWATQVKGADGQPVKPDVKERTTAGFPTHVAELTGTYTNSMGDNTPHPDWVVRAAIIETSRGMLFIKMVGPKEQMEKAKGGFEGMLDGARVP